LVELRTSQINGCAYCCALHTEEARKVNVSQDKLDVLAAWHTSKIFTDNEVAALQLCDDLTISDKKIKMINKEMLTSYFSEREIVDLTLCISIMNAFNRLAISLKD
jgi:AhpD family alkylhydroperoxidase